MLTSPGKQAYRVWSKRKQISRRHAVKLQGAIHMEEIIPAPLEEVFLVSPVNDSFSTLRVSRRGRWKISSRRLCKRYALLFVCR
ncbi:hypothetical protein LXA43DRAFT_882906 [Ganoderma leucocontextum]|nr:hypothetical protein LXA43DRAFT_882906 [Ganoderma leucocontextum]